MNTFSAIIIFTKDRPNTLIETLEGIKNENIPIIVLDDSHLTRHRDTNKSTVEEYPNVIYHGRKEQQTLFQKIDFIETRLKKFVNILGSRGWNLGYARNYAIILAKSLRLRKVLFMDDDIVVEDKTLISKIFKRLNKYDFIGSKVIGMVDDSVVGYIVRELNCVSEEYFSGGFLAFNVAVISEYFMNRYNEDWIWVYLHQIKYSCHSYGEVRQLENAKFNNAIEKAKKQEVGEILVDGVKEAVEKQNLDHLKNNKFWQRMLSEKQDYYEELKTISLQQGELNFNSILSEVATYSAKLKSRTFTSLLGNYFIARQEWNEILKLL